MRYPKLLNDRESVRLVNEFRRDFGGIAQSEEYYNLASAVRAANFDREIGDYLQSFPEATVVSIGSGLDTTFFRVDNGLLRWYDLDLPEVMALRREYVRPHGRVIPLEGSCFDYAWMDRIDYDPQKGLLLVAGGFFYYFKEPRVREFITTAAGKFPGARLVFDSATRTGLRISNRYVKRTGNREAEMHFSLNRANRYFSGYNTTVKVIGDYPFYSRIQRDRKWSRDTRFRMVFSDFFGMVKLIVLEFSWAPDLEEIV